MAKIQNITRRPALSDFSRAGPATPGAMFAALGNIAAQAANRFRQQAIQQARQKGQAEGLNDAAVAAPMDDPFAPTTPVDPSDWGRQLVRDLGQRTDLPHHAIAGIVGNLAHETGDFKHLQELNPVVPGSRGGRGIAQWTGPRRVAFESFAQEQGLDPDSYEANREFLLHELTNTPEGRVVEGLRNTSSAEDAARVFSDQFLRPGIPHMSSRISRARRFAQPLEPETVLSTDERGRSKRLKFNPLAGETQAAHAAAYQAAFAGEAIRSARDSFQTFASEDPLNPTAFVEKANQYIDTIVEQAPTDLRAGLSAELRRAARRQHIGIVDAFQADIRKRAKNTSDALVERWSGDYTEALGSGDDEGAAEALEALSGVLVAREDLPGIAWTREQSALAIEDAERRGARLREQNQRRRTAEIGQTLREVRDDVVNGRTHPEEARILEDPEFQGHPDYDNTASVVSARDRVRSMRGLPAQMQRSMIDAAREAGADEQELTILGEAFRRSVTAWENDPIAQASSVLENVPPLPGFNPTNPVAFIEAAAARRDYGDQLVREGFTSTPAYLSSSEADALRGLMSKDQPPELVGAIARSIADGFGPGASVVFNQIDAHPTIRHAGKMMAAGGSEAIAMEMVKGQQLLDQKIANAPTERKIAEGLSPDMMEALQGVPGFHNRRGEITASARALYAFHYGGEEPDDEGEAVADAMQRALGSATNARGETTGGVQTVLGRPTALPSGVSARQIERAVSRSLDQHVLEYVPVLHRMVSPTFNSEPWQAASISGEAPLWNGKPVDPRLFARDAIRFVPHRPGQYRVEVHVGSSVSDFENPDGSIFLFDMDDFIGATR